MRDKSDCYDVFETFRLESGIFTFPDKRLAYLLICTGHSRMPEKPTY